MKIIKGEGINTYIRSLKDRQDDNCELKEIVQKIIDTVKIGGDLSLFDYTKEFDKVSLESLEVTPDEMKYAKETIDLKLLNSLKAAYDNIKSFHNIQQRSSKYIDVPGGRLGEIIKPLNRVGIYVPGGKAAYPSTVLMNAIPARLAGVKEIIMVTPPMKDGSVKPSVLVAADLAGVDRIFKVGGAQAVAALTYSTESIPSVNKIVGPGNAYVATAKGLLSDKVGIDMIAGPSEILILADQYSNPKFIAADMIGQAEHDEKAASMVITTCEVMAKKIEEELNEQLKTSDRLTIVKSSLRDQGAILIVSDDSQMVSLANEIAPEHLEIQTKNAEYLVNDIENAGAIFIGNYSPEALGDYFAGPNHTLPTSGTAKFASPLGIDDFIKKTSYIHYTKEGLRDVKDKIITIATDEGLTGHANSIKVRFGGDDD
ncbi:MAG: histidinol dehydrogenase [Clostridiales bacterium]|nr:histidinol dehydrogenase [Clostridiales bacterium]